MSTLNDEFSSGLNEFFAAAGTAAMIDGVAYSVIDDGEAVEQVLVKGGVDVVPVLTLFIAEAPHRTAPRIGAPVVFNSKRYHVLSYSEDCISYTVKCGQ